MCGRFSLILCTKALMPTAFSRSSCWSSTSKAIIVPVLPTPALTERQQWKVRSQWPGVTVIREYFMYNFKSRCIIIAVCCWHSSKVQVTGAQVETSSHSVPAVNHSGFPSSLCLYVLSEQFSELDQDFGALWDSVVRPGGKVEMFHSALFWGVLLWRRFT